jgi:hypothetical protein
LISRKKITAGFAGLAAGGYGLGVAGKLFFRRNEKMNEAKPIDPQELVKWLVALRRAINSRPI